MLRKATRRWPRGRGFWIRIVRVRTRTEGSAHRRGQVKRAPSGGCRDAGDRSRRDTAKLVGRDRSGARGLAGVDRAGGAGVHHATERGAGSHARRGGAAGRRGRERHGQQHGRGDKRCGAKRLKPCGRLHWGKHIGSSSIVRRNPTMPAWKHPVRPERFAWKAWTAPDVQCRYERRWNAFAA